LYNCAITPGKPRQSIHSTVGPISKWPNRMASNVVKCKRHNFHYAPTVSFDARDHRIRVVKRAIQTERPKSPYRLQRLLHDSTFPSSLTLSPTKSSGRDLDRSVVFEDPTEDQICVIYLVLFLFGSWLFGPWTTFVFIPVFMELFLTGTTPGTRW
jgi:hypothetical protein